MVILDSTWRMVCIAMFKVFEDAESNLITSVKLQKLKVQKSMKLLVMELNGKWILDVERTRRMRTKSGNWRPCLPELGKAIVVLRSRICFDVPFELVAVKFSGLVLFAPDLLTQVWVLSHTTELNERLVHHRCRNFHA
jgi:hypothetical protein